MLSFQKRLRLTQIHPLAGAFENPANNMSPYSVLTETLEFLTEMLAVLDNHNFMHSEKYSSVNGLQTVPHIWQRSHRDNGHRVVKIRLLHLGRYISRYYALADFFLYFIYRP